ncbi:MAG: response regulator [Acholeplasmatales bacterium]|jgi:two-component system chemotaxis response regulator CheB|nr:response regulator [Acholeplasmatales bacterium]
MKKLEILIVDESISFLQMVKDYLSQDSLISNIITTTNPYEGIDLLIIDNFDYIIYDIDMSKMDGISFSRKVSEIKKIPIILTGITQIEKEILYEQNNLLFCLKPNIYHSSCKNELSIYLTTIKSHYFNEPIPKTVLYDKLIVIGASAGGTEAIDTIIKKLPALTPPIIICQHLPKTFSSMFASKLDLDSKLSCKVGLSGDLLIPSQVYICEGNAITTVVKEDCVHKIEVEQIVENIHPLPNIDILLESVSSSYKQGVVATILTGMGEDGSKGIVSIKKKGFYTIAQDEATSLVYGMPKKAIETGCIDQILPVEEIAINIMAYVLKKGDEDNEKF